MNESTAHYIIPYNSFGPFLGRISTRENVADYGKVDEFRMYGTLDVARRESEDGR